MKSTLRVAMLALFAATVAAVGPTAASAQQDQENDPCAAWQADASPGSEWDADAQEPGSEWDADAQGTGPEWDADAQEPGSEYDPENGACGAYDEDPSDNQPTNGPLENLFSVFGW